MIPFGRFGVPYSSLTSPTDMGRQPRGRAVVYSTSFFTKNIIIMEIIRKSFDFAVKEFRHINIYLEGGKAKNTS